MPRLGWRTLSVGVPAARMWIQWFLPATRSEVSSVCRAGMASKRLVANVDTALEQQIFDMSQRQRVADIIHHREADDLRRAAEIAERIPHLAKLWVPLLHINPFLSDNPRGRAPRAGRSDLCAAGGGPRLVHYSSAVNENRCPIILNHPDNWTLANIPCVQQRRPNTVTGPVLFTQFHSFLVGDALSEFLLLFISSILICNSSIFLF